MRSACQTAPHFRVKTSTSSGFRDSCHSENQKYVFTSWRTTTSLGQSPLFRPAEHWCSRGVEVKQQKPKYSSEYWRTHSDTWYKISGIPGLLRDSYWSALGTLGIETRLRERSEVAFFDVTKRRMSIMEWKVWLSWSWAKKVWRTNRDEVD